MTKLDEFKQELCKEVLMLKVEVEAQALSVKKKLGEVEDVIYTDKTEAAGTSWADVAKQRRKKHLLVGNSTDQDKKATKIKKNSQALQGNSDSSFMNGGNIVINFDDENIRNNAVQKFLKITI